MMQRTYNQYCPIAHALDIVGDRWNLLIIRDLLLGPKRFSDLREGLPGIGTNILTDRLKMLEQTAVIRRRVLPPPAASTVYELTPYGQQLEGPLQALAAWGGQSLGEIQPTQIISRDSVVLTLLSMFRRLPSSPGPTTYLIKIDDPRYTENILIRMTDNRVEIIQGDLEAEVVLQLDVAVVFALAGEIMSLPEAVEQGRVQISGLPKRVHDMLASAAS